MPQVDDDELLRKFWEIDNPHFQEPTFSIDKKSVLEHFKEKHYRNADGRFVVPLPFNSRAVPLGESRAMAVRRFKNLNSHYIVKASSKGLFVVSKSTLSLDTLSQYPREL